MYLRNVILTDNCWNYNITIIYTSSLFGHHIGKRFFKKIYKIFDVAGFGSGLLGILSSTTYCCKHWHFNKDIRINVDQCQNKLVSSVMAPFNNVSHLSCHWKKNFDVVKPDGLVGQSVWMVSKRYGFKSRYSKIFILCFIKSIFLSEIWNNILKT